MPFWLDTVSKSNGILGGGILKRFDVVMDCAHEKMYVRKNERFAEPFSQDRSGLQIRLAGNSFNQFIIADVIVGSPADAAGLQTGDIILKCNGRPFHKLTLDAITETLQKEPATVVKLTVKRGDNEFDVKFRLKDLI
jgi:C-terminal processing protease CtpA/Prc